MYSFGAIGGAHIDSCRQRNSDQQTATDNASPDGILPNHLPSQQREIIQQQLDDCINATTLT